MRSPWSVYPEWPSGHIAWRMGAGETYLTNFYAYTTSLDRPKRLAFIRSLSPVPQEWRDYVIAIYAFPADSEDDSDAMLAAEVELFGEELLDDPSSGIPRK